MDARMLGWDVGSPMHPQSNSPPPDAPPPPPRTRQGKLQETSRGRDLKGGGYSAQLREDIGNSTALHTAAFSAVSVLASALDGTGSVSTTKAPGEWKSRTAPAGVP
eukprot:CAMPEP_0180122594 /NCGR_PEP_ID=MMETSP0986-20121125/3656_1 /TAXON_ID=697907 /ORGANISM="non described non described, Strain CCMP2293" /LENGTH=105 /DNA_ID=CAMNT_0022061787 /DNA_START=324 /DNA_END=639 /DNA_ORIENTATION=-